MKLAWICSIKAGDPDKLSHELVSFERPQIWYNWAERSGTTHEDYRSYIEQVIKTLDNSEP